MKQQLENNCYLIIDEIDLSKNIVQEQLVCDELKPLKKWILNFLNSLEKEVNDNIYRLDLDVPETFPDVFKQVQLLTRYVRYCNSRLIPSVYRYKQNDKLCLKVLHWLHEQHPNVKGKEFGVSDGNFMIATSENAPIIYYLPNSSQHILLHLPLFFHEIGHYFFVKHRQEMIDLIKHLQSSLLKYFILPFQQNDKRSKVKAEEANIIVIDTWINWIQELFCDAVGIRIGGASYIHAFSFYLRTAGRGAFYKNKSNLAKSSHPVPWLRVKFLTRWAKEFGLLEEAKELSEEWESLAKMQGIKERYFGYYKEEFYKDIKECLDNMLIEADPIYFKDYDTNIKEFNSSKNNFIELVNLAWRKFYEDLEDYKGWSKSVIATLS